MLQFVFQYAGYNVMRGWVYLIYTHIYTYDREKTLSFISLIRRKNTEFENESNV